jgi:Domain of unknown function (DUF4783)
LPSAKRDFNRKEMKIYIVFVLALFSLNAFTQSDITPKVTDALKKGDAAILAQFFMPQIDLALMGQESNYSKEEAQKIIATFFQQVGATQFVIKHQGTSKLDDQYRIGELTTAKGIYRVTFFMKKSGNAILIKQLKIEGPGDED